MRKGIQKLLLIDEIFRFDLEEKLKKIGYTARGKPARFLVIQELAAWFSGCNNKLAVKRFFASCLCQPSVQLLRHQTH